MVETDDLVLYVDAQRGWSGATGTCEDPFGEISDAVDAGTEPTTLLVAAGEYGGDIVVTDDVAIHGMGAGLVTIGGVESSVAAQGGARLDLVGASLEGAWYGLWATTSTVNLVDVNLSGSLWFGAFTEQTTASFEDCLFAGNGPGGPGEISGGLLSRQSNVSVADSEFRDNAGLALAGVGGALSLRRVIISGVETDALGDLGRGVEIVAGSEGEAPSLYLEDVLVEQYADAAVTTAGAELDVTGLTVSGSGTCDTELGGVGLVLVDSESVLTDVSVTGACTAAISARGTGTLTVIDSTLTSTHAGADGLGPAARLDGVAAIFDDSYLGASIGVGVVASCGTLTLHDTSVVGTVVGDGDLGGDAVVLGDVDLEVDDGFFSDAPRCGIRIVGDGIIDVAGASFDVATADLCLCDQDVDEDWVAAFEAANTTTVEGTAVLDASEWGECPEPMPGGCG